MLQITKISRFEMAHAVFGYAGKCKYVHGHSYELHVTIGSLATEDFIEAPGFIIDFKELKQLVEEKVISRLDHKLVLSSAYLNENPELAKSENLVAWNFEPTAENILLYIKTQLAPAFKHPVQLLRLKLFETTDSYAEWLHSPVV